MDNYDLKTGARRSEFRELLIPPLAGWVLYFLIGALVLVVINSHSFWQFTTNHIIGSPDEVGVAGYSDVLRPVFNFTDKLNTPLLMLFWGIVGLVVYFFVSLVEQILSIAKTETQRSKYLQGGILPIRGYWKSTFQANLLFIALLTCWLIFFMFYIEAALPWFSKLLFSGIYYQLSPIKLLLEITGSLLGNMLCIFLFLALSKLLHNSWTSVRS